VGRVLDAPDRTALRFQLVLATTRDNYDFSGAQLTIQRADSEIA